MCWKVLFYIVHTVNKQYGPDLLVYLKIFLNRLYECIFYSLISLPTLLIVCKINCRSWSNRVFSKNGSVQFEHNQVCHTKANKWNATGVCSFPISRKIQKKFIYVGLSLSHFITYDLWSMFVINIIYSMFSWLDYSFYFTFYYQQSNKWSPAMWPE